MTEIGDSIGFAAMPLVGQRWSVIGADAEGIAGDRYFFGTYIVVRVIVGLGEGIRRCLSAVFVSVRGSNHLANS
jgi:hypothetical protein